MPKHINNENQGLIDGYSSLDSDSSDNGWACCAPCSAKLLDEERYTLHRLKKKIGVLYDQSNESHEKKLFTYYSTIFPGESPNKISPRWQRIGFQSNNPRTDFRGGGILSLDMMHYTAEAYPNEFRYMVSQSNTFGYPLSTTLINISHYMSVFLLKAEGTHAFPWLKGETATIRQKKTFAIICRDPYERAECEVFSFLVFRVHLKIGKIFKEELDRRKNPSKPVKGTAQGGTMMRFNEVFTNMHVLFKGLLNQKSIESLEDFIGVQAEDENVLVSKDGKKKRQGGLVELTDQDWEFLTKVAEDGK